MYIYIHTPCRSLLTLPSGLLVGRFCDRQRNALQHWLTSISKLANCSFDPVPPVAASCWIVQALSSWIEAGWHHQLSFVPHFMITPTLVAFWTCNWGATKNWLVPQLQGTSQEIWGRSWTQALMCYKLKAESKCCMTDRKEDSEEPTRVRTLYQQRQSQKEPTGDSPKQRVKYIILYPILPFQTIGSQRNYFLWPLGKVHSGINTSSRDGNRKCKNMRLNGMRDSVDLSHAVL